jgi:hypothetical protein
MDGFKSPSVVVYGLAQPQHKTSFLTELVHLFFTVNRWGEDPHLKFIAEGQQLVQLCFKENLAALTGADFNII